MPRIARSFILLVAVAGLVLLNGKSLDRSGFVPDALGLRPSPLRLGWSLAGAVIIAVMVGVMAGGLWLLVPSHWVRGPMSASQLIWSSTEYFLGDSGEELAFRGYLLLVVARRFGLLSALAASGIPFGVFHLPGVSGLAALKMVVTTFLGGCVFAYGCVLTGTLWTAVGLHVAGNILLHRILGLSGQESVFVPVFHDQVHSSSDPTFLVWLVVFLPTIAILAQVERGREARRPVPWRATGG